MNLAQLVQSIVDQNITVDEEYDINPITLAEIQTIQNDTEHSDLWELSIIGIGDLVDNRCSRVKITYK
jgi:hypothetical protein